jgi:hemerythrin-like domain-containing protein
MQPTEILKEEHRVIEQVLDCLERIANQCDSEDVLDKGAAHQIIEFFQNFADRCHHGKEEECLFPLLREKNLMMSHPVGRMLNEHDQGREHIRAMLAALDEKEVGTSVALFAGHAHAYVTLLREHIQKENHCLFPMAEELLSVRDMRALNHSFQHLEEDDLGGSTHEKYLKLANDLADRFGVERAAVGHDAGRGCCHSHSS